MSRDPLALHCGLDDPKYGHLVKRDPQLDFSSPNAQDL